MHGGVAKFTFIQSPDEVSQLCCLVETSALSTPKVSHLVQLRVGLRYDQTRIIVAARYYRVCYTLVS